jgi:hypothetical protein
MPLKLPLQIECNEHLERALRAAGAYSGPRNARHDYAERSGSTRAARIFDRNIMKRSSLLLALVARAGALVVRNALPRAALRPSRRSAATMICPLAPLAPVWLAGKGVIEARRRFFPDATPWPRAWEESDLWLDKSLNFKKFGSADAPEPECPVPPERRGDRRPEAFDPVDVLGEPENAGEYLLQYAALGGVATVLAGGSLYFLLAQ